MRRNSFLDGVGENNHNDILQELNEYDIDYNDHNNYNNNNNSNGKKQPPSRKTLTRTSVYSRNATLPLHSHEYKETDRDEEVTNR